MILEAQGLTKSFVGVRALDDVSFDLRQGEVHGLVGQNGAGKSTLLKLISGVYEPDSGCIKADDKVLPPGKPRARLAIGIAVIYQELTIVPEMSAAENVFLGIARRPLSFRSRSTMRRLFRELADRLGVSIDPFARAGSLSVADQQELEIMRALGARHRIVLMDEPTASLGQHERESLYRNIRALTAAGVAILRT